MKFKFADIVFNIISDEMLEVSDIIKPYEVGNDTLSDVDIHVTYKWDGKDHTSWKYVGKEVASKYYYKDGIYCCETDGVPKPTSYSEFDKELKNIKVVFNTEDYPNIGREADNILKFAPMWYVFQKYNVIFLHASMVDYNGNGIVFTAKSGTGKSTQAGLWREYKNAVITNNDRVLLRKTDDKWYAYGYPIDGSDPVRTVRRTKVSAVVSLGQEKENRIEKLNVIKSIACISSQTSMAQGYVIARENAINNAMKLCEDIPVYYLGCTPDDRAVELLYNTLKKDKVIN